MTQPHIIHVGRGSFSFPCCLSHFANETSTMDSFLDIVHQAVKSPFGRGAVELLMRVRVGTTPNKVMLRMVSRLHESNIKGVQDIHIRRIQHDCRLPLSYLTSSEPPLVMFSTPSPVCLLYMLALAGLRYPGMEKDFSVWLFAETEGEAVNYDELTEHGQWLRDQLKDIPDQPEARLPATATIFHHFVGRIEQIHVSELHD